MNALVQQLLYSVGGTAVETFKPHVVITAPNGEQLWIPVTVPNAGSDAENSSLLAGYKIRLALSDIPQLPQVTDSAARFAASQSLPLLAAYLSTPSPSGLASLKRKGLA